MNTLSTPSKNDLFGENFGSADRIGSGDGHNGIGGQSQEIPQWTDQDRICARLFESWPELPVESSKPVEETLGLLAKLDHHIHHFEVAIGCSDAGFRAWVRRHQAAMEAGLAAEPSWPKLRADDGSGAWDDGAWVARHATLFRERRRLAGLRFEQLVGGVTYYAEQLFGRDRIDGSEDNPDGGAAGARRSKARKKGNRFYVPLREPGSFWWWPLGALLARRAAQLRSDGRVLRALF